MLLRKIISILPFTFCTVMLFGQTFLNGDFEINSGMPNTNYMMMSSNAFETSVPNCYSGGNLPNLDLLAYLGTFQPQSGEWFLGVTPQDLLSLELDVPLLIGETYTMSFYDMHKEEGSLIDIGISTTPHTFGDLVYTTTQIPSLLEWKMRTFTFVANTNALFINIRQHDTGSPLLWIGVDNFVIEGENCTKTLSLGNDKIVCAGQNITLSPTGSVFQEYVWNDGSVGILKTVTQPGIYWVTGISGNCVVSDTISITAGETPNVDFESNIQTGCGSLALILSYVGLVNHHHDYYWQFGDGTSTDEAVNLHYYAAPGCYDVTLTVTSQDGCSRSLTKNDYICVDANPIADFNYSPEQIFVDDPTVQFENTSTGNMTNEWHLGNGQSSTEIHPTHTFPLNASGDYEVQLVVTSQSGCTDVVSKTISIKYPFELYLPNTFTPNDDDVNDIFVPALAHPFDVSEYNMEIYNRWGERIFATTDIMDGWDGDKALPDVYVWKVFMRHPYTHMLIEKVGRITLLK